MMVTNVTEIQQDLGEYALPDCFNLPPISSWQPSQDFDFFAEEMACPAYYNLVEQVQQSSDFEYLVKPNIEGLTTTFNTIFDENTTYTFNDLLDMCKNVYVAKREGITLKFEFSKQDIKDCNDLYNKQLYYQVYGDENLWKIGAKAYFIDLITWMNQTIIDKNNS